MYLLAVKGDETERKDATLENTSFDRFYCIKAMFKRLIICKWNPFSFLVPESDGIKVYNASILYIVIYLSTSMDVP